MTDSLLFCGLSKYAWKAQPFPWIHCCWGDIIYIKTLILVPTSYYKYNVCNVHKMYLYKNAIWVFLDVLVVNHVANQSLTETATVLWIYSEEM